MAARLMPMAGGTPISLDKPILLIGRHPDCDAVLQTNSKVSRRHCCIAQVNDRFLMRDLGSMNGVRVNGKRVIEAELQTGDELAIGDAFFVFRREEALPKKGNTANPQANSEVRNKGDAPREDLSLEYPVAVADDSDEEAVSAHANNGQKGNFKLQSDEISLKDINESAEDF